jgi:hypothetical protein
VETTVTPARARTAALALAASMMALIGALAFTGKPPGGQMLQRFEPHGIVAASPPDILRVEIKLGKERLALRRTAGGSWMLDGPAPQTASSELTSHLETALRFMHVSTPNRTLDTDDYRDAAFADFGLEPPAFAVSLGAADRSVVTADFGALTPAQTSQYVRLVGRPTLYLLPRHVGAEWQLAADLAKRSLPASTARSAPLLLPASIDQVWAVEIVFRGRLHRFERDGAGNWFLHVGQHTHTGNTPAHVADPAKAPVIAAALTAFGEAEIEAIAARRPDSSERARFGLERPILIALLYPRDSSTPLARVEVGGATDDGFSRYAQESQDGDVITIGASEPQRLIELLQAAGAAP